MSQDPTKASVAAKRLAELREAAAAMKLSYWADQIDIQIKVVQGLTAFAEGERDEGITCWATRRIAKMRVLKVSSRQDQLFRRERYWR